MVATSLTAGIAIPAAASAYTLTGAGSTLVQPLEEDSGRKDFQSKYGDTVTYSGVGSGAGIAQITARTVDFGASDAPLTPSQAAACKECVQIPWALTATGIAYNLPGVDSASASPDRCLPTSTWARSPTGTPQIREAEQGRDSAEPARSRPCSEAMAPGTPTRSPDYLSDISPTWKRKVGGASTAVSFPSGVGGKGNAGVTAVVSSTSGSIGYISASYIIAHGLPPLRCRMRRASTSTPTSAPIEAAAKVVKHVPANNELHIVDPPKSDKTAYPLSTFTYAIVPKRRHRRRRRSQARSTTRCRPVRHSERRWTSLRSRRSFSNAGVKSVRILKES